MEELFKVYRFAVEAFDKKWQQKMQKERIKNFYSPEEDEEMYRQSYRNRYFFMLLENDPWKGNNPKISTLEFTRWYFSNFKDFY